MTLNKLLIAGVAASIAAAPAFAGSADPAPATPDVAAPVSVLPDQDWTGGYVGLSAGIANLDADGTTADGPVYGLSAGYDLDLGDWVVGAGLDYERNDVTIGTDTLENTTRLKLRAGRDLGQGLIYATAGAARMETADLGDDNGYFAGVGYEHMITDQISVGGEVLYHLAEDFAGSGDDLENTTVHAKVNFRF